MSEEFILLHLSDAHIGNPKHEPDSSVVLRPLLDDLKKVSSEIGKPSLIVFSGDLAYGEIAPASLAEQYRQASAWIDSVYSSLGTDDPNETPLMLVPGNHDLNDKQVGRDQIDWVKKLEGDQGVDEVYSRMRANEIEWKRILERQKEWVEFLQSRTHPWRLDEDLNMMTGVIDHCGTKVGIAGLNSSWASSPPPKFESTDGKLWISKYQLELALEHLGETDFKIAVAHHPTDWLNPGERTWMSERIESKFNMFLHGHQHSQWFRDTAKHLMVAAGACYQGSTKQNAYSWVTLNFRQETATIKLRTYSDKGASGWIPWHIPEMTDEHGFAELTFPRKTTTSARQSARTRTPETNASPRNDQDFPNNVRDYINVLGTRFGFRWERSSFKDAQPNPIVCWPVRLRLPTPIHAVQCFAAAGLQRVGCDVVLFIDDLGNRDYSVEEFRKTLERWFSSATGDDSKLVTYQCSQLLEADDAADIWTQVKQWLGTTTYPLEKVLRVSKLLPLDPSTMSVEELGKKRPRRLLTPAVVWTCLLYLHRLEKSKPVITLAGNDELPLWQAWRECSSEPDIKVGHLYAPELNQSAANGVRPVHMSETNLAWESREDISLALEAEFSGAKGSANLLDPHMLIPWCFRECVQLPSWLNSMAEFEVDGVGITELEQLSGIEQGKLKVALVDALEQWLL